MRTLLVAATLLACITPTQRAAMPKPPTAGAVMHHAKGSFKVTIGPGEVSDLGKQAELGRMTIDKVFSGDLEATSKGEMLTGSTSETGAMAYVAMERVTGKLAGHSGTFLFMHCATMLKNDPATGQMSITVVPASATGELAGLTGSIHIIIDSAGQHTYDFEYSLPEPR